MTRSELHISCNVVPLEILAELAICGPWVVVACFCTLFARTLPDNNYEARTANFAAFSSAVTGGAFCLVYLGVFEPYQKLFYRFLGITINAILYIFCLFIVKLYGVYFVPLNGTSSQINGMMVSRSRASTGNSAGPRCRDSVYSMNTLTSTFEATFPGGQFRGPFEQGHRIRSVSDMNGLTSSYETQRRYTVPGMNNNTRSYETSYVNGVSGMNEGAGLDDLGSDDDTYL